ncbi:hypothetical protein [Kosakonia oryziphila]|uniref:Glyoxalase/Bleomycin resistance protein/Dioxygenase superfamily protein n=1 Tax=Kosakonia oryziphila TaxID=1005667 RepID=A0A1C3YU92_9ENTR|nr:hypothetical protein [Kosakonia oryziphila]SCB73671.1 hypothetical protein GA0061070_100131 [Kosakonia oryziphila]
MQQAIRGIDHIGITAPDIKEATQFLPQALSAELIYRSVSLEYNDRDNDAQQRTLCLVPGTVVKAVRMWKLAHSPGIELFEMPGPSQQEAQRVAKCLLRRREP